MRESLTVAMGDAAFAVHRPFGALDGPGKVTDVAVDGRGRVAVLLRSDPYCDPPNDPVRLFTPDGRAAGSFGREIADAHKIAADPQGRLWVVDRDAHEIIGFDHDGLPFARLGRRHGPGHPFNHPSDIAFGPDGAIAVADGYANGQVHLFGPDFGHRLSFGSVGTGPGEFLTAHGVWIAADGRIAVADRENDRVQIFDRSGALLAIWTGFHRPSDIWGGDDGLLYVSDGIPTLTCLAPDGRRLGRCRPALNGAHGIARGADGVFYLAEGTPSRVTRLVPKA